MDSKIAPQGFDKNYGKITHLRAGEKALISKRMESQKEINKTTVILDNLYTQLNGKKEKPTELRLLH